MPTFAEMGLRPTHSRADAYLLQLSSAGLFSEEELRRILVADGVAEELVALGAPASPVGTTQGLLGAIRERQPAPAAAAPTEPARPSLLRRTLEALRVGGQQVVETVGSATEGLGSFLEVSSSGGAERILPPIPGQAALGRKIKEIGGFVSETTRERLATQTPERFGEEFFAALRKDPFGTLLDRSLANAPQLGLMIAAAPAGAGALLPAFVLEGGAAYREAIDSGASEEEAVTAAGITGLVNASLERLGASKVLQGIRGGSKEAMGGFLRDVGRSLVAEGSTESLQETTSILTGLAIYAGDRGLSLGDLQQLFSIENVKRIGASGIIGSVLGGAGTVAGKTGSVIHRDRLLDLEASEATGRLNKRSSAEARARLDAREGRYEPPEDADSAKVYAEAHAEALVELPAPPVPHPVGVPDNLQVIGAEPTAPEVAEGDEVTGRPDLANPATAQGARDFSAAVQQEIKQRAEHEVRTHEQVRAEAQSRIAENGAEQETQRFLANGIRSDTHTTTARLLLNEASERALRTGDPAALALARALNLKWYEEGTEMARAFRARHDYLAPPEERARAALRDAMLAPSRTLRIRLDQASTDAELAEAEALYAREIADSREGLLRMGLDPNVLLDPNVPMTEKVQDQILLASQLAYAGKSDPTDRAIEYWRNSILSGFITHGRNIMGNTTFLAYEAFLKQPLAAGLNTVVRDANSTTPAEVLALYRGLFAPKTVAEAMKNAARSFRTETPTFRSELGDPNVDPIHRGRRRGVAIPGKLGRGVRVPQRFLLAADEFAKTITRAAFLSAYAHRAARQSGDPSLAEAFRENPTPEMMERAIDDSVRLAFQTELGSTGQGLLRLRESNRGLTFVFPFVVTPTNIVKESVKKSPLGVLNVARQYWKERRAAGRPERYSPYEYTTNERLGDLAEQLVAWGVAGFFANLAWDRDDEDLPRITGARRLTAEGREQDYRGMPPQSIRIGSTPATAEDVASGRATSLGQEIPRWFSYAEIEPLAFPLTLMVESAGGFRRVVKEGQPIGPEWEKLMATAISLVKDKTFFHGITELVELVERLGRGDGEDALAAYARNFVSSWMPNAARSTLRATSPELKDTKASGQEGGAWWAEQGEMLLYDAIPFADLAPTRYDLWGRPIVLGDLRGHPAGDFAYRLLFPARASIVEEFDADRLIRNYNVANPDAKWLPSMPDRSRVVPGTGVRIRMNRTEYQDFLQRSGTMARELILRDIREGVVSVESPTEADIEQVKFWMGHARDEVMWQMFAARAEEELEREAVN